MSVLDIENLGKPVQFPLRRTGDNSHYLSPDGRWLITGHHNRHGMDWYNTRTGQFIRRFAEEGFAGVVFDPHTGALFTCTATEHTKWDLATGQPESAVPWRISFPYQGFIGFAFDGRLALK